MVSKGLHCRQRAKVPGSFQTTSAHDREDHIPNTHQPYTATGKLKADKTATTPRGLGTKPIWSLS